MNVPNDFLTNPTAFAFFYYILVFIYTGKRYKVKEFDLNCNIAYEIISEMPDDYLTNEYIIGWMQWYLKGCKDKGLLYDAHLYISAFKKSLESWANENPYWLENHPPPLTAADIERKKAEDEFQQRLIKWDKKRARVAGMTMWEQNITKATKDKVLNHQ
jgi:hypothetical protein